MRSSTSVLGALIFILSSSSVRGDVFGKECQSNADCGTGASCVAGDSEKAVQRCVAGQACGGPYVGGCPSDEASGQLACIWRPVHSDVCVSTPAGCKKINGEYGIYKCISMDRCDQYFGNSQCTSGCNVHGKQCNGRGVCQLKESNETTPQFQCSCESGWNGTRCDNVVNDSCIANVGQCGEHGTCVNNACKCLDNYTGVQCEIKSGSNEKNSSDKDSNGVKPDGKSKENDKTPSDKADTSSVIKVAKSTDTSPTVIIVSVVAAMIVVAAIIFIVYARKRRQQQEAADDGSNFNRALSVDGTLAAPSTPKQRIVIM